MTEEDLHRWALAPFRENANTHTILESLHQALQVDEDRFLKFLGQNGLDAFWYDLLKQPGLEAVPAQFLAALKQSRLGIAAEYLAQRDALVRIDAAFNAASVRYAVFKGAHVRERVYDDPSLRPAEDIDILVARNQRDLAAQTLVREGFTAQTITDNISLEATFFDVNTDIDLHWHILRPGRTRTDLTDSFLERRRWEGFFWGLDHTDELFTLLVHPALTKYVVSPAAVLCKLVDLRAWSQSPKVNWDATLAMLDRAGLKTAAWTVLYRASLLMGTVAPPDIIERLKPGDLRSRYLRYWLDTNLPSRWIRFPRLVQIAFTLPLHDRPSDALRAIRAFLRHKQVMHDEEKSLLSAVKQAVEQP